MDGIVERFEPIPTQAGLTEAQDIEMVMKRKGKRPTRRIKKDDPSALAVKQQETETRADALAHTSLRPTVQAALTAMEYNKTFGELSLNTLVSDLGKQCEWASKGDLGRAEAMLVAQAHTLDAIFNKLARQAARCEYVNQVEMNLRLALKAQSQCRATLETLAAIKNPKPTAFVRQANIAHGPQQVNNGPIPSDEETAKTDEPASRAENKNRPNKLLEAQDGERMDIRAAGVRRQSNSDRRAFV